MSNQLQPDERTFLPPKLDFPDPGLIVAFPADRKEVSRQAYLDALTMNLQDLADQEPEQEAMDLVYRIHDLQLRAVWEIGATVVMEAQERGTLGVMGALDGFPAKLSSKPNPDQAALFNEQTLESVLLALQTPSER